MVKARDKENWKEKLEEKIMETIFGPKRETYMLLGFFWPPKQLQFLLDFG
jgi:hypothetical protein